MTKLDDDRPIVAGFSIGFTTMVTNPEEVAAFEDRIRAMVMGDYPDAAVKVRTLLCLPRVS
ncbi:MAG TPA: hypothetical protein VMS08_03660 [Candidatus Saccharimonadia bacterium]|nr:hypothetical protein [Candidatus Saccharimonadia bacterium]